jgi:sugar phosphate isomerase/epimerase
VKISFSTLGCPGWDLDRICQKGREYGYQGVDFRGYLDSLDITASPLFTDKVHATRNKLAGAGLQVSGISLSIKLCEPGLGQQNVAEAQRTIATAKGLGASRVRVFGGGDLSQYTRLELIQFASACLDEIMYLDGADHLLWLFETHDVWTRSSDCRIFMESISWKNFGVLWDIGNTLLEAGEAPEETWLAIGHWVNYVHIKDAIYDPLHPHAMQNGWRCAVPGQGELPLLDAIRVLLKQGYKGWLMFEHEKRWHPDLPDPEEAFPAFMHWLVSESGLP